VNRIVSLADDLALALRALSVRIIAPLPGKSVVGIEVANPERDTVYIHDLLEADSFLSSSSKLNIALGKDIFGNPTHADLAKMPHLLVAGATGTGKSVFLNSLLCSVLSRATPDELKLLLVDPKLLELSIYEGIPHLIADVVTNPKRAAAALSGIVHKMEERYQMMAALGVRSVEQFNARVEEELGAGKTHFRLKAKPGEEEGEEVELRRFPYIVVVIDELADLMVVSAREVEEALQRLAQMARAAGIHLVLATQRPSVDVLTGVIKANFPARISFQVSSRTDSRTILDQNGAEHLLGQGDMLFLPPGTSKLQRVHGAFVSEEEVSGLVKQLREQGGPQFDETLIRLREEAEDGQSRDDDVDEMYDRAIAIVADTRNASISYIQRRLKVGYNRAARMIEQMEADGIVGPQEGTKPREVYVSAIEPGMAPGAPRPSEGCAPQACSPAVSSRCCSSPLRRRAGRRPRSRTACGPPWRRSKSATRRSTTCARASSRRPDRSPWERRAPSPPRVAASSSPSRARCAGPTASRRRASW
jgi:S-DNA-T family DNA segregation ATPase FtsK/SpoIIIE